MEDLGALKSKSHATQIKSQTHIYIYALVAFLNLKKNWPANINKTIFVSAYLYSKIRKKKENLFILYEKNKICKNVMQY